MSNTKAKGQYSVSDSECLGSPEVEIMDITEEALDPENIHSINLNVQGLRYIHLDSGINSRPPVRRKEELEEIYSECFQDAGIFKDY